MKIDCDSRNVFWREKSQDDNTESELEESSSFVPRMTTAIYDDGDCENFELFDAVVKLLKAIEHNTFSEGQRAQEILRILHLYILPELVLKTRDITLLQDALEMVEGQIATTSKNILSKNSGICLTEYSLKPQRDKLFTENNFESETYLKTCNADFLGELLYDVERDIESLNYDLSSQQSEVDRLREAVTDEGRDKLQRIRQARDEIFVSIQKYQAIRETIKNVTVRAPSKKRNKCKRNVFHEIYLELKGRLLKEKQSVKSLCEQKLKMASVREAIVQVRDELLQKEESYGFQISREGHGTSTDVLELNNNKPSKWQTVEDKVKTIVHDGTSGPSMSLKSFCESINTKMKALMKEHDFCNLPADDPSKENGMADGDSDEFVYISYTEGPVNKQESNFHVKEGRISSGYRPYTHTIKEDILRHIKEQSRWLMDSLEMESYTEKGKLSIQLPQKVSACYESQLYNQIMTPLSQLYYLSYVDFASKLKEFIAKKSLIELGIDEPWLNDEMPTPPVAIKQKFHEHEEVSMALKDSSLKSGLSLTLRRMTLDELYQSAEKQCDDIPDSLHSPFDDDIYGGCDMQNLEDVSRSSIISIATGQESTRSSIIVEIETVAEVMEPACHAFGHCVQATSVVEKMKTFTKGYRLLNNKVCRLKSMYRRGTVDSMVCCDEILSASIVLLTLLRKEEFVQIYSNLNLVIDLKPSFLTGSVHDCSLTNLYIAYQYLFDKQVSLNRVSTLSTCR
jgi:hypothetical protein